MNAKNCHTSYTGFLCFYYSAPDGTPQNFIITATGETNITVEWSSVPCIDRNSEITGYILQYGEVSNVEREEEIVQGTGNQGAMYTITGLTQLTTYYIAIAAFSDSGTGPFASLTVETLLYGKYKHVPPPPPFLSKAIRIVCSGCFSALSNHLLGWHILASYGLGMMSSYTMYILLARPISHIIILFWVVYCLC